MTQVLAIAMGGAFGAVLRFLISGAIYGLLGRGFPYGTLAVNFIGSFALGFLFVMFVERMSVSPEWRGAVLIGLLGSFTTFSTFSLETLNLFEQMELVKAMLNILISVIACLCATAAGVILGRML